MKEAKARPEAKKPPKPAKAKNPPAVYQPHKPDPAAKRAAEASRFLSKGHPAQPKGLDRLLSVARPGVDPKDWALALKAQKRHESRSC